MRGTKSRPCQLLLLKEPKLKLPSATKMIAQSTVEVVRRIEFQFPDGAHDCESLAVDTVSRTILLVTKADPFESRVVFVATGFDDGERITDSRTTRPLGRHVCNCDGRFLRRPSFGDRQYVQRRDADARGPEKTILGRGIPRIHHRAHIANPETGRICLLHRRRQFTAA